MSESLRISTFIPAPPATVYQAWLDGEQHAAMTGAKASSQPWVGGAFTAWDGYISGNFLELLPEERIVQAWRTTEFPSDSPNSIVELEFEAEDSGTRLTLVHTNLPEGEAERCEDGWRQFYFDPAKRYFGESARNQAPAVSGAEPGAPPRRRRIVMSTATTEARRFPREPEAPPPPPAARRRRRIVSPPEASERDAGDSEVLPNEEPEMRPEADLQPAESPGTAAKKREPKRKRVSRSGRGAAASGRRRAAPKRRRPAAKKPRTRVQGRAPKKAGTRASKRGAAKSATRGGSRKQTATKAKKTAKARKTAGAKRSRARAPAKRSAGPAKKKARGTRR